MLVNGETPVVGSARAGSCVSLSCLDVALKTQSFTVAVRSAEAIPYIVILELEEEAPISSSSYGGSIPSGYPHGLSLRVVMRNNPNHG